MKKRVTLIIVVAVAVASVLSIGATLAWFSDDDAETNTMTVGNVAIDLTEPSWTDASDDGPDVRHVYPGQELDKDPQVENTGANPCLVRIQVEWPDLPGEGDITYRTGSTETLGAGWVEDSGYYYYKYALNNGEATSKLFETIVLPTGMTNGDPEVIEGIEVTAQAVQAQGIPGFTGDLSDGIDAGAEMTAVVAFFNTVFP